MHPITSPYFYENGPKKPGAKACWMEEQICYLLEKVAAQRMVSGDVRLAPTVESEASSSKI